MGSKLSGSNKSTWKGQKKHSEGGRFQSFIKPNTTDGATFGSWGSRHGTSALGQKRKLPPHEQRKEDSRIKVKP
jgi:hypothetical protein